MRGMMEIRFIYLAVAMLLAGCMGVEDETNFHAQLPFAEALLNCTGKSDQDALAASLIVSGGYQACPLVVGADESTVSGTCANIVTGQERFLFIYYTVSRVNGAQIEEKAIAYDVSYVDLTVDGLEPGQKEKVVDIGGSESTTYYSDSDADLTTINCDLDTIPTLDKAKCWVPSNGIGGISNSALQTLDSDGDGTNNFNELCSGTLFDSDTGGNGDDDDDDDDSGS